MTPQTTVMVPTYNHGPLLLRSVRSALSQTVEDIEVLIVGDGVTDETRTAISELLREDPRVRFVDYPKAVRWGEENRHRAISEARGSSICYLPDDDLWLPHHVETMVGLLANADFAHSLSIPVQSDRTVAVWTLDLSLPYHRNLVLSGVSRIGLGSTAHRTVAYGRLPHGWRSTPTGSAPILHFWQQILRLPDSKAVSGTQPTMVRFLTPERTSWNLDQRAAELDFWADRLSTPSGRNQFIAQVLDTLVRDRARQDARLYNSFDWRARILLLNAWRTRVSWTAGERLKRLPVAGRLIEAAGKALFGPIAH